MHGIINKALEDLVIRDHGADVWRQGCARAGVTHEVFVATNPYPDDLTYALVGAVSEIVGGSADDLLVALGHYWVRDVMLSHYAYLFSHRTDGFSEFLNALPSFHTGLMLALPGMVPPTLAVEWHGSRHATLHYHSHRNGLQSFVRGLLEGVGQYLQVDLELKVRTTGSGSHLADFEMAWRDQGQA